AIARTVEPAARTAAAIVPGLAKIVVHAGVNDVRISAIEAYVARSGRRADVEHTLPGSAGIGRTEDTALFVRTPGMPQRSREDNSWIFRIDDNAREALRIAQSEMLPVAASIGRLVDPVTYGCAVAWKAFPGSDVDHVRIVRRQRNRAHRQRIALVE